MMYRAYKYVTYAYLGRQNVDWGLQDSNRGLMLNSLKKNLCHLTNLFDEDYQPDN